MTESELTAKAITAKELGADIAITGQWVWASFTGKPSAETRQSLKDAGYRWSPNRGTRYFPSKPCASKTSMPWSYIVDKYGMKTLELDDATV